MDLDSNFFEIHASIKFIAKVVTDFDSASIYQLVKLFDIFINI